ncbi:MAG: FISUMP domain-containing protein [Tidjanibacter sp.]|nr:FISUMP domain-containing protein [Tidjanibacter sp.]
MNAKLLICLSLAAMTAVVGCKDPNENNPDVGGDMMLSVNVSTPFAVGKSSWSKGDKVVVASDKSNTTTVMTAGANGTTASFEGSSIEGNKFYALYPSVEGTTFNGSAFEFNIPESCAYVADAVQSVMTLSGSGTVSAGVALKPVCGILEVTFTGSTIVREMSVSSSVGIAGAAKVGVDNGSVLECSAKKLTVTDMNLTVSGSQIVDIALPVATYPDLTITLVDGDGTEFSQDFTNVACTASAPGKVEVAYSSAIDLSATESSNCYVVSGEGSYKFATKKVDGTELSGANAAMLWTSVECEWVLNEDESATAVKSVVTPKNPEWVIKDVDYDAESKMISFKTTGNVGNAVIALYNVSGNDRTIVWTWHIWATEKSLDEMKVADWQSKILVSNDQKLSWLDRNLGATAINNVDDVRAFGAYYQWGRKDPFTGAGKVGAGTLKEDSTTTFTSGFAAKDDVPFGSASMPWLANADFGGVDFAVSDVPTSVEETAKIPMTFVSDGTNWASDIALTAWGDGVSPFTKWQDWATDAEETESYTDGVRKAAAKSNNDPCPTGYRVPTCEELWSSFACWTADNSGGYNYTIHWSENVTTARSKTNYGRLIKSYADEDKTTRFPCCGHRQSGLVASSGEAVYYWTSTIDRNQLNSSKNYAFRWLIGSNMRIEGSGSFAIARPVRCVAVEK